MTFDGNEYQFRDDAASDNILDLRTTLRLVIDSGFKNRLTITSGSYTCDSSGNPWIIPVDNVPAGIYVLSFGSLASTDTSATWCRCRLFDKDGNGVSSYFTGRRGTKTFDTVTTTGTAATLRINASDTLSHSANDTITISNAMLCPSWQYDMTDEFVDYFPSNQKLYELIQALQA
jgi:hypothetical protein